MQLARQRQPSYSAPMSPLARGYVFGLIGVAIFSLTLPLTRVAVADLNPLFTSLGRTVVAALLAAPLLFLTGQTRPTRSELKQLVVVAAGVVFGFPILSALAMQVVPASHGGVVLGALPLATAVMSTIFAGERPSRAFWLWAVLGSAAVICFAVWDGGFSLHTGDFLLFGALLSAAAGYAAGGSLSRTLGGWQVISWALLVALPITLPTTLFFWPTNVSIVPPVAWVSFAYLSLMSQFIGFFAWNNGLALGGVARVGQVQLLQTFMTLGAATFINNEPLTLRAVGFGLVVATCVWMGRKSKVAVRSA